MMNTVIDLSSLDSDLQQTQLTISALEDRLAANPDCVEIAASKSIESIIPKT